jgi:HPr kinase/phosphorylase
MFPAQLARHLGSGPLTTEPGLRLQLHATGVALGGNGVAIMGRSGSGKSDLALRLIDRGAVLVCDDRIEIFESGGAPFIGACANIEGMIEVRGVGIIKTDYVPSAPLNMLVNLDQPPERLPDPWPCRTIAGFSVPELRLDAKEPSAALKVETALRWMIERQMLPPATNCADKQFEAHD